MASPSVMVTGANRGIGLELVKQLLKKKTPEYLVIGACRKPDEATDLQALRTSNPNLHLVQLEMSDYASFDPLVKKVDGILRSANPGASSPVGLNLLINNAGILQKDDFQSLSEEVMTECLKVNVLGPLFLTRAFLPLLKKAASSSHLGKDVLSPAKACVIQMSTAMSSMKENTSGGLYSYRTTKAALNMAMVNLAIDLKPEGILVMAMHPGWVKTEMGGPNALITTEECVGKMLETIDQMGEKDHGKFLRYDNTEIPW